MIRILDYGINNLHSVAKAVRFLGFEPSVEPHLRDAERLILPGVGAFAPAMRALAPHADAIRRFAESGRPVLGVCLGHQLLFERSEENGDTSGLGLLSGDVRYLRPEPGLKVPNIGWCPLAIDRQLGLTQDANSGDQVYFVHSLVARPLDPSIVVAWATHARPFAAIVNQGSVWGCQFHPEKSGAVGLRLLRRFLQC